MDKFLVKKRRGSTSNEENASVSKPKQTAGILIVEESSAKSKKPKTEKPRSYNAEYLKFGFTFAGNTNNPMPQCLVCGDILANESMLPNKLKRRLSTNHSNLITNPVEIFVQLLKSIKKQSLSFTKRMKLSSKVQEARYLVAQIIARNKVPHSIAESSIKESCCAI